MFFETTGKTVGFKDIYCEFKQTLGQFELPQYHPND